MTVKDNFFKRWFPTFVGIVEQFKTKEEVAQLPTEAPVVITPRIPRKFFIQGIDETHWQDLASRDQLLDSLGWLTTSAANRYSATPTAIAAPVEIPEPQIIAEVSPPLMPTATVVTELETTDFFIQGLRTIAGIESLKNMDLVALLTWEEQGQTLLEVDPDDYELLDDLLDVAEI